MVDFDRESDQKIQLGMNGGGGSGGGGDGGMTPPSPPLDWKFSQVFGERTAGEEIQEGILDLLILAFFRFSDFFWCGLLCFM